MPTSLRELGVNPTPAQLEEMADKCALAVAVPAAACRS